jgi:hypothetical protein
VRSAALPRVLSATLFLAAGLTGFSVAPAGAEMPTGTDRGPVQLVQATPTADPATEKDAINAVLNGYYDAFGRDAAAAAALYGEPTLMVAPDHVIGLNTRADLEAYFDRGAATLKRYGFSHSTLSDRRIKLLTSTTALCGGIAIRMKTDGTEMGRFGYTYLLQKGSAGWRIHQIITTDLDKLIRGD